MAATRDMANPWDSRRRQSLSLRQGMLLRLWIYGVLWGLFWVLFALSQPARVLPLVLLPFSVVGFFGLLGYWLLWKKADPGAPLRFFLALDILAISLLVYLSGGVDGPFVIAYMVILIAWDLRSSLVIIALATVILWAQTWLVYAGLLVDYHLLGVSFNMHGSAPALLKALGAYSGIFIMVGTVNSQIARSRTRRAHQTAQAAAFQTLITFMEGKLPTLKGQAERCAHYACLIGEAMGLTTEQLATLWDTALLHDIGKLFLPDELLEANSLLGQVEQFYLRQHVLLGQELLLRAGFSPEIATAVRHHHEFYGGNGYPDGISGEVIPLFSRIIVVADVWEAMITGRELPGAMSVDEARAQLKMHQYIQFDPLVVQVALKVLPQASQPQAEGAHPSAGPSLGSLQSEWTKGMLTATQYRAATTLFRLGQEVSPMLAPEAFIAKGLGIIRETLRLKGVVGSVFLKKERRLVFSGGLDTPPGSRGMTLPMEQGLLGWIATNGIPRLISNVAAIPEAVQASSSGKGSMLVMPLAHGQTVLGVLAMEHPDTDYFSLDAQRLWEVITPIFTALLEAAIHHEEVQQAALYDPMTGIHNIRYFSDRLKEELARHTRSKLPFTLVLVDIDQLKEINDVYGHPAGDQVLKTTAQLLQQNLRASDVVARYGGDEFVVLLPETNTSEAGVVMDRMMKLMNGVLILHNRKTFDLPGRSFGIATFPDDGTSTSELLDKADQALYEQKREHRQAAPQGTRSEG